jgi:hypothetical protein
VVINPHGATSQMTAFFIVTAVKTSNPTKSHKVRLDTDVNLGLNAVRYACISIRSINVAVNSLGQGSRKSLTDTMTVTSFTKLTATVSVCSR